ncbi:hypothetical protein ABZ953_09820 [Streptomyces sp. NPDC046465]|uniref:hypothetical protein n=1 Tax=Streptomyces sp. NPDC046465 TaxID=3155810 RepID=UPI0033C80FC2
MNLQEFTHPENPVRFPKPLLGDPYFALRGRQGQRSAGTDEQVSTSEKLPHGWPDR